MEQKELARKEHIELLKEQARKLPPVPGVYLMRAEDDELIYVGKAANLSKRVISYFRSGGDGRQQIEFLLRRVHKIEKIVTSTEEQALILERDLINKHKPRYNIRLKDDKSYISVRIDKNSAWPRLELVRKVFQDGALYFGPYTDGGQIREILEIIKSVIPLRTCTDTVFYNRQRPCLEYQIKRCSGPCCLEVDRDEYMQWVEKAISLLQGKTGEVETYMEARMRKASENLQFEEAAVVRDKISLLEEYGKRGSQKYHHAESRDCFGIQRQGSLLIVYVLKIRNGRLSDSSKFSLENVYISNEELMENVLLQYYRQERQVPQEVLVNYMPSGLKFVKKILSDLREEAVDISRPLRGSKKHLLEMANLNAEQEFQNIFLEEERYAAVTQQLAERFKLKQIPRKIECVDISNFQGSDIVGAVVSFFDGKPRKEDYKKYKISFQKKPDDFAAIGEVVNRRLKRGMQEGDLPDLLIIDGGSQQLAKAIEARDSQHLVLDIIALAKMRSEKRSTGRGAVEKPERVFTEGSEEAIILNAQDALTHFLQRIRDEAHRYVITFHRATRAKRVFKSILDDIPGLGPERKGRLLRHFGKLSAIAAAETPELAKVGRMPLSLAEKVKRFLRQSPF